MLTRRRSRPTSRYLSYPYSVASNGQRFLIATDAAQRQGTVETPLTVVVNWVAALKK